MKHAIEIVVGAPLVSISGAVVGGWLAMISFVIQDRMGPENRDLIRSLVFRSMVIGLIFGVIMILMGEFFIFLLGLTVPIEDYPLIGRLLSLVGK